jgi:hypothetical protein
MELRCWDPECVGNDLTAGTVPSGSPYAPSCTYCGESLQRDGRVIASSQEGTAALTAVPAGEEDVLVCVLADDGEVLWAAVYRGEDALALEGSLRGSGGEE